MAEETQGNRESNPKTDHKPNNNRRPNKNTNQGAKQVATTMLTKARSQTMQTKTKVVIVTADNLHQLMKI